MEQLFRKNNKGRYEACGYDVQNQISDGLWLVQTKPNSRSLTSLVWKVGDLKRPADVVTIAALQSFESTLVNYLAKLTEEGSEELKEAREILGGCSKGTIGYRNISASDLCSLFLRRLAMECEETTTPKSWESLFFEFREDNQVKDDDVKLLYRLVDWLKSKNYKLKL
jgi:hypothetical protein